MRIFLVRHGESVANIGGNYEHRLPDHLVQLSPKGIEQARNAGLWLANYCYSKEIDLNNSRIWRSPFIRTRQTCDEFNKFLNITDIREEVSLIEQQFGLFDAIPKKQWAELYPAEYEEYVRQRENGGKFFTKLPLGESPFDVSIRAYQFLDIVRRDYAEDGVETLFVFTHGTTLRTILLRYFRYSPEWYHDERNPKNCAIREIVDHTDCGYINM